MRVLKKITSYQFTKRQKLIFMTFVLTFILVLTQTVSESLRYQTMGVLVLATIFLSTFALWGELAGVKYFLLLLLPVYFVAGASLFYLLLPVRWLTRLPFAMLFGISVYLLMLTSNIYNIAAIRTIALLRAAHAVGLLFSLIATFFLSNVLFSLHWPFFLVTLCIFLISMPLYLVGLWSYELENFISRKVFNFAFTLGILTSQAALILSFWPIAPINGALAICTIMYALLGLSSLHFEDKLKGRVVVEHLAITLVVFIVIIISTGWGG